jgi:hypothetical protein
VLGELWYPFFAWLVTSIVTSRPSTTAARTAAIRSPGAKTPAGTTFTTRTIAAGATIASLARIAAATS